MSDEDRRRLEAIISARNAQDWPRDTEMGQAITWFIAKLRDAEAELAERKRHDAAVAKDELSGAVRYWRTRAERLEGALRKIWEQDRPEKHGTCPRCDQMQHKDLCPVGIAFRAHLDDIAPGAAPQGRADIKEHRPDCNAWWGTSDGRRSPCDCPARPPQGSEGP